MVITLESWDTLRCFRDGDAIFIVGPDFVDLQESPAVCYSFGEMYDILDEWMTATPVAHLPLYEVVDIICKLSKG